MSSDNGETFHITVEMVAAVPGSADRLLAEHTNDGTGRCRVCTIGGQAGNRQWPCWLYHVGMAARKQRRRRHEA
jgi:hypothetical protein